MNLPTEKTTYTMLYLGIALWLIFHFMNGEMIQVLANRAGIEAVQTDGKERADAQDAQEAKLQLAIASCHWRVGSDALAETSDIFSLPKAMTLCPELRLLNTNSERPLVKFGQAMSDYSRVYTNGVLEEFQRIKDEPIWVNFNAYRRLPRQP